MVSQPFSIFHLAVLIIALAAFVLFVWALVSISKSTSVTQSVKVLWLLLVIFAPFVGSVIWFAVGARGAKPTSSQ